MATVKQVYMIVGYPKQGDFNLNVELWDDPDTAVKRVNVLEAANSATHRFTLRPISTNVEVDKLV